MYYPLFIKASLFTKFLRHCDSRYVGRTSQKLQQRIKQHVPKTILQKHISQDRSTLPRSCKPIRFKTETSFSAIRQYLFKTLHAHTNIMTTNFLFLPVAVLLFTFPPLKPRTLKHPNQIYANKRNSFMVQKSHISFRSFYWSLLLPIMIELFSLFFFFVNCVSI